MTATTKRQNFNITPEQEAELAWLQQAIAAPTAKDTLLRAVRVLATLARQAQQGHRLYIGTASGPVAQLLIPELEAVGANEWKYLVSRPHAWRRQLYIKGRKMLASTVWRETQINRLSPEEASYNWDLPLAVLDEITRYCEANRDLLAMESDEERRFLLAEGVELEPRQEPYQRSAALESPSAESESISCAS